MPYITRAQRLALKRIYDQSKLYHREGNTGFTSDPTLAQGWRVATPHTISYRTFRRAVRPGYDCIMIQWCGMWLGVEKDGYTHS